MLDGISYIARHVDEVSCRVLFDRTPTPLAFVELRNPTIALPAGYRAPSMKRAVSSLSCAGLFLIPTRASVGEWLFVSLNTPPSRTGT